MNSRALTLSLVMAVLAVFFVQSYVSSIEESARRKYGTDVLVIKAKKDIKEQDTLNETMLSLEVMPKRFLEPAAIYFEKTEEDRETTKSMKALVGNVAMVPIKKGEQITYNKLTEPSVRTGLAPQIAPGRRAVAIPVSDVTGVSKLVKPGDRVDLIAVLDSGNGKENRIAKTVLQDVVVLSVGRNVTNNVARIVEADSFAPGGARVKSLVEDTSFTTVTVEVEPVQAQALALLSTNGDNAVVLSLRNNDDAERTNAGSTMLVDVLGPDGVRVPARGVAGGRR